MPGAVSAAFPPRPEQPDSARRGPGRAPGERAPEEGGRLRFRRWEGKRERRGEGVKRRRKKKKREGDRNFKRPTRSCEAGGPAAAGTIPACVSGCVTPPLPLNPWGGEPCGCQTGAGAACACRGGLLPGRAAAGSPWSRASARGFGRVGRGAAVLGPALAAGGRVFAERRPYSRELHFDLVVQPS